MIYFTSDLHFSHENIMKYCGRQFLNKDIMNSHIIKEYNNIVKKDDTCYILGDMCLDIKKRELQHYISLMNGKKILIAGNHDSFKIYDYYDMGFDAVYGHIKMIYKNKEIYIVHDPALAQIPDTLWFCGHVHNLFKKLTTLNNSVIINVGVDVWDYKPQTIDYLIDYSLNDEDIIYNKEASESLRPTNRFNKINHFDIIEVN